MPPCSDTHFIPILEELRAQACPDTLGDTLNPPMPDTNQRPGLPHEPQSAPHQRSSAAPNPKPKGKHACPDRGRWGGRRPGAGAPKGNLNGLKHGLRSRQFAAIGALLAQDPTVRAALLAMGKKHQLKHRKAQQVAAALIASLF